MIVSASYRTDIPAFYAEWFAHRLKQGWASYRNPYSGREHRLRLDPEAAEGFVFWTRNLGPFFPVLDQLRAAGRPFVVQFTLTGYPAALERATQPVETAVAQLERLAERFGPRVGVWRYDPVFLSDPTPAAFHREQVARLAERLAPLVDEAAFSFAQIYAKTRRNTERAATRHGFGWHDPEAAEKRALLAELAGIAAAAGLRPTLCSQPELLSPPFEPARCIDAARLSDVAEDVGGAPVTARQKGNRPGCLCAESRDLGAYDSCPHGCVYCYAVRDRALALRTYRAHDPAAPGIAPPAGAR